LLILDGVARTLDPDFNTVEQVRPFIQRLQRDKYRPSTLLRELRRFSSSTFRLLHGLPRDIATIVSKLKQGTLTIEFEHKGLEGLTRELDRTSNRISFSLITAALIVGSSIIVLANRGPQYLGLPMLGLIGYVIAGLMGVWLIIIILRSGNL
jgi:ubiquinone biosynthesis protein